jgi:hypothetical protein
MTDVIIDRARAFLRGHSTGDLRFEEHLRPVRYVLSRDGQIIAPAMVAMLRAVDCVLFIPECADGAMEVQVTLEEFDEHGPMGALTDRWRIYHGDPEDIYWAVLHIDAARFAGAIIDGPALKCVNELADDEPRLCREMNRQHADDLRRLCRHFADIEVEEPVMVGIDPLGLDVRGTFDVIRVPTPQPMQTADDAQRVLDEMMKDAAATANKS